MNNWVVSQFNIGTNPKLWKLLRSSFQDTRLFILFGGGQHSCPLLPYTHVSFQLLFHCFLPFDDIVYASLQRRCCYFHNYTRIAEASQSLSPQIFSLFLAQPLDGLLLILTPCHSPNRGHNHPTASSTLSSLFTCMHEFVIHLML